MEARRRQLQYIGKLMRKIDPEPIQAQLDIFAGNSAAEVAKMFTASSACASSCSRTSRSSAPSPRPGPALICSTCAPCAAMP